MTADCHPRYYLHVTAVPTADLPRALADATATARATHGPHARLVSHAHSPLPTPDTLLLTLLYAY